MNWVTYDTVAGTCPASPALDGGVKGANVKKTPHWEAPPSRAGGFSRLHSEKILARDPQNLTLLTQSTQISAPFL
jgi:hypothetical protein